MRIGAFALFLYSLSSFAQQKDTVALRYSAYITKEDLKKHLSILASDGYEGRETGKPGQKKAAEYISAQFKSFGIPPYKEGLYLQPFDVYPVNASGITITIKDKAYKFLQDYYSYRGTSDKITQSDEFVFAGYGINDSNYTDYKDIDVQNKIVIVLGGEPLRDSVSLVSKSRVPSEWSEEERLKIKAAKEHGAAALFIVSDAFDEELKRAVFLTEHSPLKLEKPENISLPAFAISEKMFASLMEQLKEKRTLKELREQIAAKGRSIHFEGSAHAEIDYHQQESLLHSENVLGFVEGSDLKNEIIVISGHYDHLGVVDGKIYNGADDDGSGTTAVIELAQTFMRAKKQGHGPRRSMLFLTVAGEEKGLLGSSYYVAHPEFPLANTVCDLNIDMVGRVDEKHRDSTGYVYAIGSSMLSTRMHTVLEQCNSTYSHLNIDYMYDDPKDKNRFYYRSDHYNFAKNNIPVIFFFNGTHKDYHKETDEVDKIDFALMEKRVKLVFFIAWTLANSDQRPELDVQQKK
jgi:hypothetical protein